MRGLLGQCRSLRVLSFSVIRGGGAGDKRRALNPVICPAAQNPTTLKVGFFPAVMT